MEGGGFEDILYSEINDSLTKNETKFEILTNSFAKFTCKWEEAIPVPNFSTIEQISKAEERRILYDTNLKIILFVCYNISPLSS